MGIHLFILNIFLLAQTSSEILVPSWFDPARHTDKVNILKYNGIVVYAENLDVNELHMVFDLEIRNNTLFTIKAYRDKVSFIGSNVPFPVKGDPAALRLFETNLKKYQPLSEEVVAGDMIEFVKRKKKTSTFLGFLTTGLIILDAAMDIKDNTCKEWTPARQRNSDIRNLLTMAGVVTTDAVRRQAIGSTSGYREDLHFLHREIFRFGEIEAGDSVRGKVFFPCNRDQYIRLIVLLENTEFVLDFRWADHKDLRKLREK